ncbi:MAG: chemotaxis protein CheA, partial [Pseudomonadota bacterium]
MEDLLERLRKKTMRPDQSLISLLLNGADFLKEMLGNVSGGKQECNPDEFNQMMASIKICLEAQSVSAQEKQDGTKKQAQPRQQTPDEPSTVKPRGSTSTVRIRTKRLDRLVNLMEEMTIGLYDLYFYMQQSHLSSNGKYIEKLEQLIRIGKEAQEQVMKARMFPLADVFGRFQRMARDLSISQNKPINITMSGSEIELDKDLLQKIEDPLKHIIRNCIDHGIEPIEERITKGKPEEGLVSFLAYQKEGRIFIEISDDGRGIDEDLVLDKACRLNLIPKGFLPSKNDLYDLLFMPGFSSRDEINEISGRGVGLDVVKNNLTKLGGSITVISEKGKGATFIINLPLTLVIMKVMRVCVGEEVFMIPFPAIAALIKPKKDDIKTVEGKEELISFREEYIPLVRLENLLQVKQTDNRKSVGIAVVIKTEKHSFALYVDDVEEEQQVVIKNIETHFQKVPGIAGGTVLEEGAIALILDVYSLEKTIFPQEAQSEQASALAAKDQDHLNLGCLLMAS